MHYDSVAFSKNGRNTMEAVDGRFTPIIGTALELSVADVKKVSNFFDALLEMKFPYRSKHNVGSIASSSTSR